MLLRNNVEWNERTARYLQIRRCSSCRLRRCFEMGMKEELVRTEAENERYRQLVSLNRKRRDIMKQQLIEIKQSSIPQVCMLTGCDEFYTLRKNTNVTGALINDRLIMLCNMNT